MYQQLNNNKNDIGNSVKKKALILAIGLAFATPTISVAKALPSNLVGINLGEIQSHSYLNEPYQGIIPILFANVDASSKLNVTLAPESIFQRIGAEKLPVLDSLTFDITLKNNKPVISITSAQPIQMPFLNFVLEIESPKGVIYQDYTTLLDPKQKNAHSFSSAPQEITLQENTVLRESIATSSAILNTNRTLKVKSGDTLSQIAQALNTADISLKKMVNAIHQRNPNAFINNNINKLKAGTVLHIPTQSELKNSSFKTAAKTALKKRSTSFNKPLSDANTYTIKQGDNLSTITKKFGHGGVSFTKMMKAIHTANPHAFSKEKINLLKVGKTLTIPSFESITPVNTGLAKSDPVLVDLDYSETKITNIESDSPVLNTKNHKEFILDGFVVEQGDTLAKITKEIGHKSIPYSKMMQAIYTANPDAFEKNNITTLIAGSIIRLPSIAEIEGTNSTKIEPTENKPTEPVKAKDNLINQSTTNASDNVVINKLEKRVRELKRDLDKAHTNLSTLEQSLSDKEGLLQQQSKNLSNLASAVEQLKGENEQQITPAPDEFVVNSFETNNPPSATDTAEKTALKNTKTQPELMKSEVFSSTQNITSKLAEYSQYMSGKELFAAILALLFGLVLVRYRREIYAYTSISYDYPKYYPPFGEEKAKALLKEKSIITQEPLVNATSDIHEENNPTFSNELLQECEELADELTDNFDIKTSVHSDNANWDELDKTCDEYIEEYKEKNVIEVTDVSDNIIEGTKTEPEEMTFELFEALAEGVTKNNMNTSSNILEDDTIIYDMDNNQDQLDDIFDVQEILPFSELATLSEKIDKERKQVS